MTITTHFERQGDRIIFQRPERQGKALLLEADMSEATMPGASMEKVEAAIRIAYSFGRQDERRQTAAVMRGLLGEG